MGSLGQMFSFFFLVLASITFVCLYRTLVVFKVPEPEPDCKQIHSKDPAFDTDILVARFSKAIQFKTISRGVGLIDEKELDRFVNWLELAYPSFHKSKFVKYERVANYSLLYTIKGRNAALKPYMLCSHLDVVPVELDKWTVDPFAGLVKNGYIYGRGTIDVKDTLMAIYESFEYLFKNENFQPERGVVIAFGHDEEAAGVFGANEIGKILKSRNVQVEYILDEGTFITEDSFPGVNELIAFVGVAEKGYLTINYTARSVAGHSSMPTKDLSIAKIGRVASKFKSDALPNLFGQGPEVVMIETLAPYASFPFNLVYSNLWIFGPVISRLFENSPMGNSLVRTTTSPTIIRAGFKDNILPSEASLVINQRVHPSQSVAEVLQLNRDLIDDNEVEEKVELQFEPHPYSPWDAESFGYQTVSRSIRQVFRDILVVPGIMVASTDTKHYLHLTKSIYRFSPTILKPSEIKLFHGHDERISVENYVKIVHFYYHLILMSNKADLEQPKVRDEL